MDLHCHFHTFPLLFRLFLLFYIHFLSIEKYKNLLFKGEMGIQNAKGICVEKYPAVSREEQTGVYWRVSSFLGQVFLLLPNPLH
jgi:hypothetical protein